MPLRINRWRMRSAATAAAPAFSPAGAFGLGDDNTNDCPQGLARMANESACQSAVTVAGSPYTYRGSIAVSYLPKGCVWFKAGGGFYFNAVTTGAPRLFAQPVCAGAQSLAATPVHVLCWFGVRCTDTRVPARFPSLRASARLPPVYGHRSKAARTNVFRRSGDSFACAQPDESIRARQRRRLPAAPVPDHDCGGMRECRGRRRQTVPWPPGFALHAERLLLALDRRKLLLQHEHIRLRREPRRAARVRRCACFVRRPSIKTSLRAARPRLSRPCTIVRLQARRRDLLVQGVTHIRRACLKHRIPHSTELTFSCSALPMAPNARQTWPRSPVRRRARVRRPSPGTPLHTVAL
jgi:hypothetical protein